MSEVHTDKSTGAKYCLGCGYIIDHLPEPRCPECGREFDPGDPLTFYLQPPGFRQRTIRRSLQAALILTLAILAIGVTLLLRVETWHGLVILLFALAGAGLGSFLLSEVCVAATEWFPPWCDRGIRDQAWLAGLAFAASVLIILASLCIIGALVILGALVFAKLL
jgi:hypothetical protein